MERIRRFQAEVAHLRRVETNPVNYRLSVSGFLAEIDRMQLEVREYLSLHPTDRPPVLEAYNRDLPAAAADGRERPQLSATLDHSTGFSDGRT